MGVARTRESNGDGQFTVPELPIGRYSVDVTMTGFAPYHAEGINIEVAARVNLTVTLQTGAQKEEVVLSGTRCRWRPHRTCWPLLLPPATRRTFR